jgi:hypothetical protein
MEPLQPQQQISDMQRAFADAAEGWLLRPRNPHADAAVLDAIQRRQEHQDDIQRSHTIPLDHRLHAAPSPASVWAARLVKLQGQQKHGEWLVPRDRPVLIGRSGQSTSSLDVDLWPDASVARRHALIWFDGEGWRIEDWGSTNGTLLGGSNIRGQRARRLALGIKMRLGRTMLMLMALEKAGELTAEPGADSAEQGVAGV